MDHCKTCGQKTEGMACSECGMTCGQFGADHKCGGNHCESVCTGCSKTENKCTCQKEEIHSS